MKFLTAIVATFTLSFSAISLAETKTLKVSGMHCAACEKSIEEKVCGSGNFKTCSVNRIKGEKNMGHLNISTEEGTPINETQISELLAEAGDDYALVKESPAKTPKKKK